MHLGTSTQDTLFVFTGDLIPMSRHKSSSPLGMTPRGQFEINDVFFDSGRFDNYDHHNGGRALDAIIRAYAAKVSGIPLVMRFNYKSADFFLEFVAPQPSAESPPSSRFMHLDCTTEIFVPNYHYGGEKLLVSVSDGVWKYDPDKQTLYWEYDRTYASTTRMEYAMINDDDKLISILSSVVSLFGSVLSFIFGGLSKSKSRKRTESVGRDVVHWIHIRPAPEPASKKNLSMRRRQKN